MATMGSFYFWPGNNMAVVKSNSDKPEDEQPSHEYATRSKDASVNQVKQAPAQAVEPPQPAPKRMVCR